MASEKRVDASDPMVQNIIFFALSGAKVTTRERMLLTNMEKMTPIRIIVYVARELSSLYARERIIKREMQANSMDIPMVPSCSNPGTVIPKASERTAPSAAPDDTPMVEPSARGFCSSPCMHAPHRERAAPSRATQITLGSLTERIIALKALGGTSLPRMLSSIILTVSLIGIFTLPATIHTSSADTVMIMNRRYWTELKPSLFLILFSLVIYVFTLL